MAKQIKFNVRITLDGKEQLVTATSTVSELRRSMDKAKSSASKLRDTLLTYTQTVQTMQNVSNAIAQLTNTFNAVVEESRAFDEAMKATNTMAGKDAQGFAKIKDQVAELSNTIPMARDLLAKGLYQVISNGVPEDNWISFLEASAKSAVGGIADVNEVVKVTSTVIKNYGLEWSDAQEIQDKIQLTAKNGVTSFEQLATALPSVTGQAAQLNVSFTEMLAVMSTLTGVTGNTAEVSTQLASVLTALTKESSISQKMAADMGISFNAASIKAAGGLRNYLQELDRAVTAYAAKSGELKESIYSRLFGRAEALRLVNSLTGQMAQKFDENIAALETSAGTMAMAYENMANTNTAKLQILKNEWGKYTDWIADKVGAIQPLLNFGSQLGMTTVSVLTLLEAFKKLHIIQSIMSKSLVRNIAIYALFGSNTRKVAQATNVMSQSFRSAATRAIALKIAIRGLMAATGVGLALTALGAVISKLFGALNKTKRAAESTTIGLRDLGKAADTVKEAYERTLESTYSSLMSKYEELKESWRALTTVQQKKEWILQQQSAFADLRISINSILDAEGLFNGNTDVVVEAFMRRAKAAARMAQLTELYRKQIELTNKYSTTKNEIQNEVRKSGRHAQKGDIVPVGWRNERYGAVDREGKWRFTEQGAKIYSGTDLSSNYLLKNIKKEIEDNDTEITRLKQQIESDNKPANELISPKSKTPKLEPEKGKKEPRSAVQGSIDWYQQRLDDLRKKIYATGDQVVAHKLQANYQELEKELTSYKIKIGLEKPEKLETKTYLEILQLQLADAQKELDNTTEIEARVVASAKVDQIQAKIDEVTKGKLSIDADIEPSYMIRGSREDKRQSYVNAQSKADRIQQDFKIGLIGKDEALQQISELNLLLEKMGMEPIVIEVMTDDIEYAKERFKGAAEAIGSMGQAFSGLGNAMELPELNVAGTIAQAIATMAAGYATATKEAATLGPWAWIAFAATGLAQLAAMITSVKNITAFANGGIVSGPTLALVGEYAGATNNPEVIAPLDKLRNMIQPVGGVEGVVRFEIEGRKLVGVIANQTRIGSKSGRRTNIKT